MKILKLILIFSIPIIFNFCVNKDSKKTENQDPNKYKLVWSDEFEYTGLPDSSKWIYDTEGNEAGWGNSESQYYTRSRIENAWVKDGILHLTAQRENYKNKQYTSARLNSNKAWHYGKIEVRAKIPPARGTWSAIWMMPGGWTFNDGNWPDVGEFDIMEHVGYDPGVIHASAHSKDYQWQAGTQKTNIIKIEDATENFHNYIWEWDADLIKAFVDDSLYFEYKNEGLGETKWPYDKPFYLILNLAIGGAWGSIQGIDDTAFPQSLEIDYVRVFQKK